MKRIIILFISVLITYLFLKFIIHDFILGHDINYQVKDKKNTFQIKEVLNLKKNQDINNYYFEITKNKTKFIFKTDYNFKKDIKIIEQIKYFKNNSYECLLPIFKNDKIPLDMMCYYDKELYFYNSLPKKDQELKKFVKNINDIYNPNDWLDNKSNTKKDTSLTMYPDNIISNHYIALDNYRGIYLIDEDNILTNIKLFKEDVYETHLKGLINNNFIIANYNDIHDFNQFYIVNITNGKKDEITVNYDISFDSYVNGVYNDSLFVTDRETKTQYEINLKQKEAYITGNQKKGILIIKNNKEKTVELNSKKEYKFNNYQKDKTYNRIDNIAGYYYLYKKVNNNYQVYKAPVENKKYPVYLFETDNIEDIYYIDNYLYFKNKNDVLYYKDDIGIRTLFTNTEYEFNENLKYYVYNRR